jgi:hypothetical protein
MNTRTKSAQRSSEAAKAKDRRILLFGDSHTNAIQRAIEKRQGKGQSVPLVAHRLLKEKNGRDLGDTRFEDFLKLVSKLSPDDVVLSAIGGNQYAVYSMIQHDQRFDIVDPEQGGSGDSSAEIIPYRAIEEAFFTGLRNSDAKSLQALRAATSARVIHLIPPPPKRDNAFITEHHETLFRREGLATRGVSAPELRLKFWRMQTRVLQAICAELGIEVLMPPGRALDESGFLQPEFYAVDATHANWRYGERLMREIERRFLPAHSRAKAKA